MSALMGDGRPTPGQPAGPPPRPTMPPPPPPPSPNSLPGAALITVSRPGPHLRARQGHSSAGGDVARRPLRIQHAADVQLDARGTTAARRQARTPAHARVRADVTLPSAALGGVRRAGASTSYRLTVLAAAAAVVVGCALLAAASTRPDVVVPVTLAGLWVWLSTIATPKSLWPKAGAR